MKTVSGEAMKIVGIKTRTTNKEEMMGAGKISGLWQQFFGEQVLNKIPNKMNQNVLAVYHAYESDANGPYTLLLGVQVEPETETPEGLTAIQIPAADYSIYTTDKGEMPGVVVNTWMKIWGDESTGQLKRKYTYDFELYDARSADPKSSQVDVYIAT